VVSVWMVCLGERGGLARCVARDRGANGGDLGDVGRGGSRGEVPRRTRFGERPSSAADPSLTAL
jgi:hypothetical protein